jgi:ABC-type transporter Mla MlaB component
LRPARERCWGRSSAARWPRSSSVRHGVTALETLTLNPTRPIVVDASRVEYIDDVGIALLFDLIRRERPPEAKVEIRDLAPNLAALVHEYDPKDFIQAARGRARIGLFEQIGRATEQQVAYTKRMLGFLGRCAAALGLPSRAVGR